MMMKNSVHKTLDRIGRSPYTPVVQILIGVAPKIYGFQFKGFFIGQFFICQVYYSLY